MTGGGWVVAALAALSIVAGVAPAGTPREVVTILNVRLNDLIRSPDFQVRMKSFGLVPRGGPPEDLATWVSVEREKWVRVVKTSGAKAN